MGEGTMHLGSLQFKFWFGSIYMLSQLRVGTGKFLYHEKNTTYHNQHHHAPYPLTKKFTPLYRLRLSNQKTPYWMTLISKQALK